MSSCAPAFFRMSRCLWCSILTQRDCAPSVLGYILQLLVGAKYGGRAELGELGLPVTESGMALPCGATGRWIAKPAL